MDAFEVVGGTRLVGDVTVGGAKNSALKLMAAALLAPGKTTLRRVPDILDVRVMAELLRRLGCEVTQEEGGSVVEIDVPEKLRHQADYDLVRRMRASICVLGPLVARCGQAEVALPGGDAIGSRGVDLHVAGLERLGVDVRAEHGYLLARTSDAMRGASIWLDFPSVGATENILMAAVLAKGTTVIDNAPREPEIQDLCRMLVGMGAVIDGIGSATLEVTGVERMHPVEHATVSDRIVAGTWAVAAVMTQGEVRVREAVPGHLEMALDKLVTAGARVELTFDGFEVSMEGRPHAVDVVTLPYPGFPTDLQPQFIALNAIAEGAAMVTENLFDGRFRFVQELRRLGAQVQTDGHHALVRGVPRLSGAPVEATDVRAGAGLVLAGLVADGLTRVYDVSHIDRGYERFVPDLQALGAIIQRVEID
ncbi:MAG: UDP-N-acetylglucosamine 1-carboxyvinyltransferase [Candidatus Nanopelagicales bacterium]|nr:UDP-N-acetylglucosamine 1-carboxyvinyltransferase [Candidatus Nanopelagicales bacterium]